MTTPINKIYEALTTAKFQDLMSLSQTINEQCINYDDDSYDEDVADEDKPSWYKFYKTLSGALHDLSVDTHNASRGIHTFPHVTSYVASGLRFTPIPEND